MRKLLCVTYGGGHVRACLPVLRELRQRGWHIDLLALTTAYESAVKAGFRPWRAKDLLVETDEELVSCGRALSRDYPPNASVPLDETIAYLGFGFRDLCLTYGPKEAGRRINERGRSGFEHRLLASRAIDRFAPDIVLATNSPRAEWAAIAEAQRRSIPALVINDLLASASNLWLHDPAYADEIFVLNDFVRARLVQSGHAPEKIIVTGNPAFAGLHDLRERRMRRAANAHPTIVYASQPLPKQDEAHHSAMKCLIHELACRRKEWIFRVRLHPNENAAGAWLGPPVIHDADASLEADLMAADVLITHGSTVGMEASIAGVPVILQLGSGVSEDVRYDQLGIAVPNRELKHLENTISRVLQGSGCNLAEMPGNSEIRIADRIEEILGNA